MHLEDGAWLSCPNDQYYDKTTRKCRDWESYCSDLWAYREACFEWPTGQLFDVESMSCKDSCTEEL